MRLVDSHCHIHDTEYYQENREEVYKRAVDAGVAMICVGTSLQDSQDAVNFANTHDDTWAVVGIHPHEASGGVDGVEDLLKHSNKKLVGIGEVGLDYFYTNSPKPDQIIVLEQHLQWAVDYNLPISFHVREAFDDFWPIFDNFHGLNGVLHSFTDSVENLEKALSRGLSIGVNGIATFAKNRTDVYKAIPLEKMCLETDAPFLTPAPHRGKVNEPALLTHVAGYVANLQSINLSELSQATTRCANEIFSLKN